MKLVDFLGLRLKDDAVIDLLECYEIAVVYDFDRDNENIADEYSASAKPAGFELRFNEHQILETIWCYVRGRDGFVPVDPQLIGVPCYLSFADAKSAAIEAGCAMSESPSGNLLKTKWLRMETRERWTHYEFVDEQLALVTIMLPWE